MSFASLIRRTVVEQITFNSFVSTITTLIVWFLDDYQKIITRLGKFRTALYCMWVE
jgi:hypothetical protein